MKKLFILIIVLAGFGVSSYGQVSANAASSATIITPIAINKTADLNFGNIASDATGGTVTVSAAGARSASGVTLPASAPGTVSAASFTVTGSGSSTFSISMPSSVTLTRASGTETMTVGSFTNSSGGATGTLSSGSNTLTVGAQLTVAANQVAGTYSNATGLAVTVNYN